MLDDELWEDLQSLLTATRERLGSESNSSERALLSQCLALLEHETKKVESLRMGTSRLLPYQVYLSVSSFNKGRIEIGGNWQEGTALGAKALKITEEAYQLYRETRPQID